MSSLGRLPNVSSTAVRLPILLHLHLAFVIEWMNVLQGRDIKIK